MEFLGCARGVWKQCLCWYETAKSHTKICRKLPFHTLCKNMDAYKTEKSPKNYQMRSQKGKQTVKIANVARPFPPCFQLFYCEFIWNMNLKFSISFYCFSERLQKKLHWHFWNVHEAKELRVLFMVIRVRKQQKIVSSFVHAFQSFIKNCFFIHPFDALYWILLH